jgi:hypothetical protein
MALSECEDAQLLVEGDVKHYDHGYSCPEAQQGALLRVGPTRPGELFPAAPCPT